MKKILLLPMLLLFAVACSTDQDELLTVQDTAASASTAKLTTTTEACYSNLTATVTNTGSLTNPIWKFTPDIPTPVAGTQGFQVFLEYQGTDCEDITTGTTLIFSKSGGTFTTPNTVMPFVQALPSQLLPCYRWRIKINGVNGKNYTAVNCTQYTPWYDAPLN
jgi:hypothetical protein